MHEAYACEPEPKPQKLGCKIHTCLVPALFCWTMDYIMDRVSRKVDIQVGQLTFTDTDYADDVTLLVD